MPALIVQTLLQRNLKGIKTCIIRQLGLGALLYERLGQSDITDATGDH